MQVGDTVSHYRVREQLGSGGMGVVFKAEDLTLGRYVALKFLAPEVDDPGAVARFQAEARSLSALNHPNICTIHEIGSYDGRPFLAMELLEGQPLHRAIGDRPLALQTLLDLAVQVADALEAAHSTGLVHRDIKPANVFVTRRGQAKVLDFGLAKFTRDPHAGLGQTLAPTGSGVAGPVTASGMTMGTVAFMSPEQARGEALDGRSDIFSFGLVLYQMATGRQTFEGNTAAVVFDAILNRQPVPPGELNPDLPVELERIITKSIEKDARFRYQAAAELRTDLQRLKRDVEGGRALPTSGQMAAAAASGLVPAAPPSQAAVQTYSEGTVVAGGAAASAMHAAVEQARAAERAARGRRRRGGLAIGLAALVLVAIGIAAVVVFHPFRAPEPTAPATPAAAQAPPLPSTPVANPSAQAPVVLPQADATPRAASAAAPAGDGQARVAVPPGAAATKRGGAVPADAASAAAAARGGRPGTKAEQEAAADLDVARTKLDRKLYDQAVDDLKAFVDKRPGSALAPEATFLIAEARRLQGRREDAMGGYVEFGARYKTHARAPEALFRLAQLTSQGTRQGSLEEARQLYGEVSERYGDSSWAAMALVERAAIEDRLKLRLVDQALATSVPASLVSLRRLVQQHPSHPLAEKAYWTLADGYEEIKRYQQAAEACESLAQAFPATKYDAWFRAGEIYERRLKDKDKARAAFAQVPESSPRFKDAQKRAAAK
jgi:TolA-binding protein